VEKGRTVAHRIAIVGSGIAGLTVAYLLSRRHEITVFEAEDRVGGHTNTVEVADNGRTVAVDTGFIVYNERTYPSFCRLLDQLGVATQPSDMSFSFSDEVTGLEYGAPAITALFAQPGNLLRPRFWSMLRDIRRFYREMPGLLAADDPALDRSLAELLDERAYGEAFVDDHLVPVAAAIWSASRRAIGAYPARAFVRFFRNHGLLSLTDRPQWRTIAGGSARYVEKLTASFRDRIRLGTPVTGLRRDRDGVLVGTPCAEPERFDKVVLACHADEALDLLSDASPLEREMLAAFPYAANEVLLHSDPSLMPRRRAAWASWNYHRLREDRDRVAVTYHQNRLQRLDARRPYLVTLNRSEAVAPAAVHGRFDYAHPQYDARSLAMQSLHARLGGMNHTWFCGAYWGYGFHEDGVVSALRVARDFGEELG
jgi:predicted NAD/FAD-binding protein